MKIALNTRSASELIALMEAMDIRSPSHLVQLLITKQFKSVHSPSVEEEPNEHHRKEKEV
jgi:hypothetical protein